MTNLKTLLASAAVVAMAALPVSALSVGTDASILTGADVTLSTTDADTGFVGDVVKTADGVDVGRVLGKFVAADGSTQVAVDVDDNFAGIEDAFSVEIDHTASSDGEILLPWTSAELLAAVQAKM